MSAAARTKGAKARERVEMVAAKRWSDDEVRKAVMQSGGSLAAAASLLRVSPRTLARRLKSLDPANARFADDRREQLKEVERAIVRNAILNDHGASIRLILRNTDFSPQVDLLRKSD